MLLLRHARLPLAVCLGLALAHPAVAESIPEGEGRFDFDGGKGRPIPVYTYRPAGFEPEGPVLIIMHGAKRNAVSYRKPWIEQAEKHGLLLVLPQFAKADYPNRDYQRVGVLDKGKRVRPSDRWTCQQIDRLFEHVVRENDLAAEQYYFYGHSAGGQFVHRAMLVNRSPLVALALPANAGWYTLPLLDKPYPEGLAGTGIDAQALARTLEHPTIVLLGEADNDAKHSMLPTQEAARRQGAHRFDRGHYFMARMKEAAAELGCKLNWRVQEIAGVGHSNGGVAPVAAELVAEHHKRARLVAQ